MNRESQSDSSQAQQRGKLDGRQSGQSSQKPQSSAQSQSSQGFQPQSMNAAESGEAFDPVCGMAVDTSDESTERLEHKGNVVYFCSSDCREQYEASPDDFQE